MATLTITTNEIELIEINSDVVTAISSTQLQQSTGTKLGDANNGSNNLEEPSSESEEVPLGRMQLTLITISLALTVFLVALDEAIIATAIPKITDHFHSLKDVGWYGSAYFLTMCCFQLHYGKLHTYFSSKNVLLVSVSIFELGSLICATSQSSAILITGRAIAGSGAGGIVVGSLIIISKTVPIQERSTYTAAVGSIYGIASIVGPLLGGVITDSRLTWRWCFYLNLPFGVFSSVILLLVYKPRKEESTGRLTAMEHIKRMDPIGLLFFVASMVCLILGLQESGSNGWSNPRVISLFALFGIFILAFTAVQIWLQEAATLPPRIIMKRQVIASSFFVLTIDGSFYVLSYFLPIWFQSVKGTSAVESGIHCIPMIIGAVSSSVVSGVFISKTGNLGPVVVAASVMTAAGVGLLTTMNAKSGAAEYIGYQAMAGIGIGLGMQQGIIVVQNKLDPADIPTAISTVAFFQALGPTLLVSLTQNIFSRILLHKLLSLIPTLTPTEILNAGATKIVGLLPTTDITIGLSRLSSALTESWYVAVVAASLSGLGALGIGFGKFKVD